MILVGNLSRKETPCFLSAIFLLPEKETFLAYLWRRFLFLNVETGLIMWILMDSLGMTANFSFDAM